MCLSCPPMVGKVVGSLFVEVCFLSAMVFLAGCLNQEYFKRIVLFKTSDKVGVIIRKTVYHKKHLLTSLQLIGEIV